MASKGSKYLVIKLMPRLAVVVSVALNALLLATELFTQASLSGMALKITLTITTKNYTANINDGQFLKPINVVL
jgi:hypothetical protein